MSLQRRYFWWLCYAIVLLFIIQIMGWFVYEVADSFYGRGQPVSEELGELIALLAAGAIGLPLMLALLWVLSHRLVEPLKSMAEVAQRIGAGRITERIEASFEDEEVRFLAGAMNAAFDRYKELVLRLERFANNASHELRTPLTAIRSTGEVALLRDRTSREYRETIGSMLEEAQRLSRVIEKLLALSATSPWSKDLSLVPLELREVVERIVTRYEPVFTQKQIEASITLHEGLCVEGDADLLEQAVANLVDNALKAVPDGGHIGISAGNSGEWINLQVSDTGPGIPEEYRRSIFEPFSKLPDRQSEGSGLGLAIVADIVTLHGGTIEAGTNDNGGSTFRVALPRAQKYSLRT